MRKKILVIGGDKRFKYLQGFLSPCFEVIPFPENTNDSFSLFTIENADIVVLPYPISFDGISVNAPLHTGTLHLSEVLSHLLPNQLLLTGGKLPKGLPEVCCKTADYTDSEEFLCDNAVLTAEGLLRAVIEELPKSLYEVSVAVTGYGRVGKAAAELLKNCGCHVTVFARREKSIFEALHRNMRAFPYEEFTLLADSFDCVINSVPCEVLGAERLGALRSDCVIFEAASAPYGIDFKAADKLLLKTVIAGSLPGKTSPETAARIIYRSVMKLCFEGG